MFNFIENPENNELINIQSKNGIKILTKYLSIKSWTVSFDNKISSFVSEKFLVCGYILAPSSSTV